MSTLRSLFLVVAFSALSAALFFTLRHEPVKAPLIIPAKAASGSAHAWPVLFEPNVGQADPSAHFVARASHLQATFTTTGPVLSAKDSSGQDHQLKMALRGAELSAPIAGEAARTKVNYYLGSLRRTGVPTYSSIVYESAWQDVDLRFHGEDGSLEFDFELAPFADPEQIHFSFDGADSVALDSSGLLSLGSGGAKFLLQPPRVFTENADGRREMVAARYTLDEGEVGFKVAAHDESRRLIIDPVIVYQMEVGGSAADQFVSVATDSNGVAYVLGTTKSAQFNVSVPQPDGGNTPNQEDIVIAAIPASGGQPLWSTFYGGSNIDTAGAATLASDKVYFTGICRSNDAPLMNAFQSTLAGNSDAVIATVSQTNGTLQYATLFGSAGDDSPRTLSATASGTVAVGGGCIWNSSGCSLPPATLQGSTPSSGQYYDWVAVIDTTATPSKATWDSLVNFNIFQTTLYSVAIAPNGHLFLGGTSNGNNILGNDGFIAEMDPTVSGSSSYIRSYTLGGTGNYSAQSFSAVAIDGSGNVFACGTTEGSVSATVTGGSQTSFGGGSTDAFLAKFSPTLQVGWMSYLGGTSNETCYGLALDPSGALVATGTVLPYSAGALPTFPESTSLPFSTTSSLTSSFIAKVTPAGQRLWLAGIPVPPATVTANPTLRFSSVAGAQSGDVVVAGYTDSDGLIPQVNSWSDAGFSGGGSDGVLLRMNYTPQIDAGTPLVASTAGGTSLTLKGAYFISPTVTVDGQSATVSSSFASQVTFTAPAHALGAAALLVKNASTESALWNGGLQYDDPPVVTSLSPNHGPSQFNTNVQVLGSNFSPSATVQIFTTTLVSTWVNSGRIDVVVPSGNGSRPITVRNPDGLTASANFTSDPAPSLVNFSPLTGPSSGGTQVTVSGSNFVSGALVYFGDAGVTSTFTSSSSIKALAPARPSGGSVKLQVMNPDQQLSAVSGASFTYSVPPQVTALTPNSGTSVGGTTVTISGANFVTTPVPTVTVDGVQVPVSGVTSTQLTFTAPAHAVGTASVVVTNSDGQSSASTPFTYVGPSITSVSPDAGTSAGQTTITINGAAFSGATVYVGDAGAFNPQTVSSTRVTAVTPPCGPGLVDVTVRNSDGVSTTAPNAYFCGALSITDMTPKQATTFGGTAFTITGNFFGITPTVKFGNTVAVADTQDEHTITGTVPAHPILGPVLVTVTNTDGTMASFNGFSYLGPTPTAISPTSGTGDGGTSFNVSGSNFAPGATVRFGGSLATNVTFLNSGLLTGVTPPSDAGVVDVVVTNSDGVQGQLNGAYTYYARPIITDFTPKVLAAQKGNQQLTITGDFFRNPVQVKFNGQTATVANAISGQSITTTMPSQPSAGPVAITVVNPDGQSFTATQTLSVNDSPAPTTLTPNHGPDTGGTALSIFGSQFTAGAVVKFGASGTPVVPTAVISDSEIDVTTPPHAPGSVQVIVVNEDGLSAAVSSSLFTFDQTGNFDAGLLPDAGSDAGVDAGEVDAGALVDAGQPDSGVDAGTDAGTTEEVDAGVDAGTEQPAGGNDAGVSADRSPVGFSCGCGAGSPAALMPFAFLLFAAAARRRRRA